MKIIQPQIPEKLDEGAELLSLARIHMEEETSMMGQRFCTEEAEYAELSKLDVRQSVFENCSLRDCRFDGASFIDVVFEGCNFSNSCFADAYFERCQFVACKCVGTDLGGAVLKQLSVRDTNFEYACFDRAKITGLLLEGVDMTEASISEAKLKGIELRNTRLIKNNFFKTMLSGIDFTKSQLIAPTLSSPPAELRGAKITMLQAVELIGLWGVIVE